MNDVDGEKETINNNNNKSSSAHLSCFLVTLIDYDHVQPNNDKTILYHLKSTIYVQCTMFKTTDSQSSNTYMRAVCSVYDGRRLSRKKNARTSFSTEWIEGLQLLLLFISSFCLSFLAGQHQPKELITVIVWLYCISVFIIIYLVYRKNDNFQYFVFIFFCRRLTLDWICFDFVDRLMQ